MSTLHFSSILTFDIMCGRVLFVLVIVFNICSVRAHPAKTCPDGWIKFKSSCYGVGTEEVTWADAQEICGQYGGHLAEIETTEENEFVKELHRSRGYIGVFLGALDVFVDGHWVWASDRRPLTFNDWYPGQQTGNDGGSQDCLLSLHYNNQYKWHDGTCSFKYHFICETRSDDTLPLKAVVAQQASELSALKAELLALRTQVNTLETSKGSTFVRWGRSQCPAGTQILYSGVAGGSAHAESGGAANRVCLTTEPVFDNMSVDTAYGKLTGVQYFIPGHHHTDVLCAVCYTPRTASFMVPGTTKCPADSVAQYSGYLTSTHYQNVATAEFLCLDSSPEDRMGSEAPADQSAYIEHAVTVCGSLPCPPYVNGKVATCVVCSK